MNEKFTDEEEDEIGAADNGVSCSGGSQRRPSTSIVGRLRVMRPPLISDADGSGHGERCRAEQIGVTVLLVGHRVVQPH